MDSSTSILKLQSNTSHQHQTWGAFCIKHLLDAGSRASSYGSLPGILLVLRLLLRGRKVLCNCWLPMCPPRRPKLGFGLWTKSPGLSGVASLPLSWTSNLQHAGAVLVCQKKDPTSSHQGSRCLRFASPRRTHLNLESHAVAGNVADIRRLPTHP